MIKNFIYLDEEKMYSLSSQIFEGVTEYVLNENSKESEDNESQKGPVGSGKILGDILRQVDKKIEKRFLNDFSYTLFEKKLLDDQKVIEVKENSLIDDLRNKAKTTSFIKVTAKAVFNDMALIKNTLTNFNKIGLALAHIQTKEVLELNQPKKSSQIDAKAIEKFAKENGLQMDQKFLENIALILDYGFQDQLEIQMQLTDSIVSANLKRDYLRENEELITKKYSRRTECNFVIFGILTQYKHKEENLALIKTTNEVSSIKEHLMGMVMSLANIEETFIGRLNNEVIIDPIALYTEL